MGLETSTITFLAKYLRSSKIQIVVLLTYFSRVTLLTVFEPRNKKKISALFYTTTLSYLVVLTLAKVK